MLKAKVRCPLCTCMIWVGEDVYCANCDREFSYDEVGLNEDSFKDVMNKDDIPEQVVTCFETKEVCPICGKLLISGGRYLWCSDTTCKFARKV